MNKLRELQEGDRFRTRDGEEGVVRGEDEVGNIIVEWSDTGEKDLAQRTMEVEFIGDSRTAKIGSQLIRLGNQNPHLRDNIAPLLRHLKSANHKEGEMTIVESRGSGLPYFPEMAITEFDPDRIIRMEGKKEPGDTGRGYFGGGDKYLKQVDDQIGDLLIDMEDVLKRYDIRLDRAGIDVGETDDSVVRIAFPLERATPDLEAIKSDLAQET